MLAPRDIVEAASRRWPAVLRAEAQGESLFPLRIRFGRPKTTADFAVLQKEIEALASAPFPWRVDWEEIQTRKWGRQRWPVRVAFDTAESLARTLNRTQQLERVREAIRIARDGCPALEPWLRTRADRIVEHLDYWPGLVAVCRYFDDHPQPQCFARQIPLPVGTKFIDEHGAILKELLDVVLGDRANRNAAAFADRFHLLTEPAQVRFRFLDSSLQSACGWPVAECTIPLPVFADQSWNVQRVLVVENRDVFLCLPQLPRILAVFGAGKAASILPCAHWLAETDIVYWGDCDDAGYGILSALRACFPHLRSVLMDDAAWSTWKHLAVPGKRDASVHHLHLTDSERSAHNAVLAGPWMLEQERIPPADAERALQSAFAR
jgi:hypothetical protein